MCELRVMCVTGVQVKMDQHQHHHHHHHQYEAVTTSSPVQQAVSAVSRVAPYPTPQQYMLNKRAKYAGVTAAAAAAGGGGGGHEVCGPHTHTHTLLMS